ncbi:protein ANTI-SILENCING 1-like isoform X2 [Aristolochia californica]|uniref:protein ANTI-SILENCING 1-like isoform X2 n=1 Tax=Aristolochia californica TaxID=171875 RepID=UPI0035DE953A
MSTSIGDMPITYSSVEANLGIEPKFKWGKKRGVGGAKKDVQFYESFTYDGIEYFLYDCVYLYKEADPEPYIGKLVKIFGKKHEKKIKVVWFFRPIEISNWLGDTKPLQNEIFLASGEGVGVWNLNPLEVLVGKCNVICTSKDKRNPQPSSEDLRRADFFFYRTFDVGKMTISESVDGQIAGIEGAGILPVLNSEKLAEEMAELKVEQKSNTNRMNSMKVIPPLVSNSKLDEVRVSPNEEHEEHRSGTQDNRPMKKRRVSETLLRSTRDQQGVEASRDHGSASGTIARTSGIAAKMGRGISFDKDKALSQEKGVRPSEGLVLDKAAQFVVQEKNAKATSKPVEVTRRPNADRSKWFKALPWEDRMQTAEHQGTLLLLENLDPSYTSAEIEDVIWHGLGASCTAKVVPRTKFSSPHSGQAFVIFKSRDAAANALKKLNERCFLLPNGRPLVCSRGTPREPGKKANFFGHLSVDNVKRMQRDDTRNAVSTSHCAQPNTIEYEMSMEWKLLQEKSVVWWKELYKQQGDELRKLRRELQGK